MTATAETNGKAWWPESSDEGGSWWTGSTTADATIPPPPPPPPPAPATAVVPPVSPAPPRHARPAGPVAVPTGQDPDGDGWAAVPPVSPPVQPTAAAVVPVEKPKLEKPRAAWLDGVKGRYGAKRGRYRMALPAIGIVLALVLARQGLKTMGHEVSKGLGSTIDQHDETIVSAVQAMRVPASQQVVVTNSLSWLPCPLTADAKGMIGYDPPSGPTLNSARAQAVSDQAHLLLAEHTAAEFRISQPDATHLVVFAGAPTAGVPLIDCAAQTAASQLTTSSTAGR